MTVNICLLVFLQDN